MPKMSRCVCPSKSRARVNGFCAKAAEIAERVVAVARPLAVHDDARLPAARRRPEQLSLRGEGLARIEVVAGQIVDREPVAATVCSDGATPSLPSTTGPADAAAHVARVDVGEWHRQAAGPAESDGRALVTLITPPSVLRPNSALCGPRTNSTCPTSSRSMLDVLEFSCGTPSKYVVTAGLAGARTDAAEPRVAQLAGRELGEVECSAHKSSLADDVAPGVPKRLLRHRGQADRQFLRVGRLFLGRHHQRWQLKRARPAGGRVDRCDWARPGIGRQANR